MPTKMSRAQEKACNTRRLNKRQAGAFYDYPYFDLNDGPETLGLLVTDIEPCGDIMCHHSETFFRGKNHVIQLNAMARCRFGLLLFATRRLVLIFIVFGGDRRSMQAAKQKCTLDKIRAAGGFWVAPAVAPAR
jgi:hypothetical protein